MAPVVVPRSAEPWDREQPYRVEHAVPDGGRRTVYFEGVAEAAEFAKHHELWGHVCDVESKEMPVSHRVERFSLVDPKYVLSHRVYGQVADAIARFERIREHVHRHGGGVRLVEVATNKHLEQFTNWVD